MKIKLPFLVLCLLLISTQRIEAKDQMFSIEHSVVEVCYGCQINDFLDVPAITLNEGFEDKDFYLIKDQINNTFLSVINTKILRTYTHYYKAVSPKYHTFKIFSITFIIKDTIPPEVISDKQVVIDYGQRHIDFSLYLDYQDNQTKKQDIKMVVNDQSINYDIIGSYQVIIDLFDESNNQTRLKLNVVIIDEIMPHIVLTKPLMIERNQVPSYEKYFLIVDNYHTSIDVTYDDRLVDYKTPGIYSLTVSAIDQSLNESTMVYKVVVRDLDKPEIKLRYTQVTLEVYDHTFDYFDPILYLIDNNDFLDIEQLTIIGEINFDVIGRYEITYLLSDHYGNQSEKMLIVLVDDKVSPTLVFDVLRIKRYETSIDYFEGVVVSDNYDTNAFINLSVHSHNIDVNTPGVYYINYECFDLKGNYVYETRTVNVYEIEVKKQAKTPIYLGISSVVILSVIGVIFYAKYKKNQDRS
jgi:hypothetical protein